MIWIEGQPPARNPLSPMNRPAILDDPRAHRAFQLWAKAPMQTDTETYRLAQRFVAALLQVSGQ